MIQRNDQLGQTLNWQKSLSESFTKISDLLDYLQLTAREVQASEKAAMQFRCLVTKSFAGRMQKGNPLDPLLQQVLPSRWENEPSNGFVKDPVGDLNANPVPGVLHKYRGRLLLLTNGGCASNCRYCFRRHFPYEENSLSHTHLTQALDYIKQDETVSEIIFSGGEPLLNSDSKIAEWIESLAAINHITRIRFHSRLPIFLPERVTSSFIRTIACTRLKPVIVIHSNHPAELNNTVKEALLRLHSAKILVLNQSVILRGINDNSETLAHLSEALFSANVLPYYLHTLDPVLGAAHFDCDLNYVKTIYAELCDRLPGFLVPKLVKEIPGYKSKTSLNPNFQL